jgi:hypothetical protein
VRTSQRVAVKFEAFNLTDCGLLEGRVTNIGRDAIDQGQQPAGSVRDENGRSSQPGLVYAVSLLRQRFCRSFPLANQFAALHHMRDGFERRDIVQRIDRDRD